MKRKFRLTRSTDFKRVRRTGKSYAHPLIVLIALPNEQACLRIGIAAGKTVGGAVQRNHVKRIIRAALQEFLPKVSSGWDIVILARAPMAEANYLQVQEAVKTLLERAHLIENMYVS